jgi:phosphoribosylaminoimidazolecarboxamide formyltransferase/IMP cyclohydrolase
VTTGASFEECIEQIDVGGPTMIRAAAKNHHYVTVVTHPMDYTPLVAQLEAHQGSTALQFRTNLAVKAFAHTASYDAMIAQWFTASQAQNNPSQEPFPEDLVIAGARKNLLRYGENPHQAAALYQLPGSKEGIASAQMHQGKELSYNNINDANAAMELVSEFSEPAAAIIKHANPCGVSVGNTLAEAYRQAFACDPKSAFGGVIALNRRVEAELAEQILQSFSEVVIAPEIAPEALALFAKKPNIRLLTVPVFLPHAPTTMVTSLRGGFLLQMRDAISGYQHEMHCVTEAKPSDAMLEELRFAFTVCKHVKSNAIVISARYQVLGTGAGQMSRVDAVRIACGKYQERSATLGMQEVAAVLASDAFFPFADGIEMAAAAGIKAIIQPSGSMRDQEVIARANELGLIIMHTNIRHFKH